MNTERLIRQALEDSVKDLPCPEPETEQLVAAGRKARRRRVSVVASLAAAAVLVLVLAGLSFAWAGRSGRAQEPVPANPTTTSTPFQAPPSDLQVWIDDLPTGAPPATPYWHDGTLNVNGEQIPAPYDTVNLQVAGDTILVGGYQAGSVPYQGSTVSGSNQAEANDPQWGIVRGDRIEPLPVPAGAQVGLSVDGRILYWIVGTDAPNTKQFFTWDTETKSALASRTVQGGQVELWGVDAAGNGYWQEDALSGPYTRWDVRADKVTATDLTYGPWDPPESFDGFVPWMPSADPYRSPDGTKVVFTGSIPSDSPSDCCINQLRVRPVGPDDSLDPNDVTMLSLSQMLPPYIHPIYLGDSNEYGVWWESNESVLLTIHGDSSTYLVRCPADGGACQRAADFGASAPPPDGSNADWIAGWVFAQAPASP